MGLGCVRRRNKGKVIESQLRGDFPLSLSCLRSLDYGKAIKNIFRYSERGCVCVCATASLCLEYNRSSAAERETERESSSRDE